MLGTSCANPSDPSLWAQGQHYERWSHYADGDKTGINSERRGEGRRLRRQRRKERHRQQEHEVRSCSGFMPVDAQPLTRVCFTVGGGCRCRSAEG